MILSNLTDNAYGAGSIARLLLLGDARLANWSAAVDTATNTLLGSAHGLTSGARVRVRGAVLPTPLLAMRDYRVLVLSPTEIQLVDTLGGIAIDLIDTGSGVTIDEQLPNNTDPIDVLVAKELLATAGYIRQSIAVGAAVVVGDGAQKSDTLSLTATAPINYRHSLVAFGAGSTVGDTSGITHWYLQSEPTVQSISTGETRDFTVRLGMRI
jgi:hypothetical protein